MDNGYFNHVRPISPTGTVDSRSRDGPNPESPFIFGRTPSLRLEIPSLNPLPIPFPYSKPPLERRTSSLSHHSTCSTTSAQIIAPPARPYQLPPGLADSPLPSALDVKAGLRGSSRLARGPKIDNEPPIPLEIQHLLLTTPPPPRFNATSVAFASMSYPPSVPADWEEPREKMPTLLKRIRALTLRSRKEEHEVVVPARLTQPRQEVLDLKKSAQRKVEPGTISDGIPRSWKAYETLYAAGRLDVEEPPLPPLQTSAHSQIFPSAPVSKRPRPLTSLSPYDLSHFPAPLHLSRLSPIRERLIASLDLLGKFLPADDTLLSSQLASYSPTIPNPTSSPSFGILSSPSSPQSSAVHSNRTHSSSFRSRGLSSASTSASTTYSTLQSSHFPSSSSSPFPRSIRNHASLQALLGRLASNESRSRSPTSVGRSSYITLFPTSPATAYLDVLASAGSFHPSKQVELELALDAHTILNGSKGLVAYDVERDWRFRGNRDVEERNIRFYAGMPIFAPSSLSLGTADSTLSVAQFEEEAGGARIAIGVLSIVEELPRKVGSFGTAERAKLRSIASEITVEIEHFILQRAMSLEALSSRRTSATSAATFQSGSIPTFRSTRLDSRGSAPPSPQRTRSGKGHVKKVSFDANAMNEPIIQPIASNPLTKSTPLQPDETDSVPSLFHSHPPQKLLDLACASLAKSLNLRLVYLVELDQLPPRPAFLGPSPRLSLISSHGLPPSPDGTPHSANFDPLLHLRALRAPEGGLLYRAASSAEPFDSGMLLPVTEIESLSKGWVIAGYAEEEGRTWGEEEMEIFEKVTKGVEKILLWREEGCR